MSEPYLGEIKLVSFDYAPKGWAFAAGQILQISQNQALFSLLGTTYGGDGVRTFALPDLQGRVVVHSGPTVSLGEKAGVESVTLLTANLPAHHHSLSALSTPGNSSSPQGNALAGAPIGLGNVYSSSAGNVAMSPASQPPIGGGQPHENRMPSLTMNYVIALVGIFPSRN